MAERGPAFAENEAQRTEGYSGVRLKVVYDGRLFSGFARQDNGRTIAGELDGAIRCLDPAASFVRGVSRTDRGVHAYSQFVAFETKLNIPSRGWVLGLAPHLPDQISVVQAAQVPTGYLPHRDALKKTYVYRLLQCRVRDPFLDGRVWRVPNRLNQIAMQTALGTILGEHDFRAFRAAADSRRDTIRQIYRVSVEQDPADPRGILVVVQGNRFMYRMVRIIVGTLVDIARGRLQADAFERALRSGLRTDLGITAPPDGLYLMDVELARLGNDVWPHDSSID